MNAVRTIDIPLALCMARTDARPVDADKVKQLKLSFAEVGLLQPVTVRERIGGADDGAFEVIAGLHRVTAAREMGWATISAMVVETDELRAELILIDENLVRNELSPAERAAAIARRKAIYKLLHPETAHGGDRRSSRQVGDLKPETDAADDAADRADADRFTRATARLAGLGERTVQREAKRGETIGQEALAKVARTSLDKGEELDALAKLPEARRAALIDRAAAGERVSAKIEAKRHLRDTREKVTAGILAALPAKRFGVAIEDFEWHHDAWTNGGIGNRHPSMHYETAEEANTPESIVARCAERFAMLADDCILLKWTTIPHLAIALRTVELQGFAYKTHLVWAKDRVGGARGHGYWFTGEHELVLVCTRGHVVPPATAHFRSLFHAPVGAHSEKPLNVHEIVEYHWPNTPKIELNARVARPGWAAWGNEVGFVEVNQSREPADGGDPDQDATGGRLKSPLMEAEQAGESDAGETMTAGASAASSPALLAPGEPASVEGGCGHVPEFLPISAENGAAASGPDDPAGGLRSAPQAGDGPGLADAALPGPASCDAACAEGAGPSDLDIPSFLNRRVIGEHKAST